MKVVTGKKTSPTPVLADRMTTVVFSPYWNIPQDIVRKEILPKLEKDPSYLEKNNMEADDKGNYRQRPGQGNSLGQVKFLFPNHYNVYLHDTPAQALFERIERDFSHGCVRLDEPMKLAQYVLRDQPEWTDDEDQRGDGRRAPRTLGGAEAAAADLSRLLHRLGRQRRAAARSRTSTASIAATPRPPAEQ